jgi:hypothetical protein
MTENRSGKAERDPAPSRPQPEENSRFRRSQACEQAGHPAQEASVKKKRFSVEQITAIVKQAEGGVAVGDVLGR